MAYSIRNISYISEQDITTIANCDLNTHLIAYKINAEPGSKITTLAKRDVNCWQLFLRLFGQGNLVNYHIGLATITTKLNQFNWKEGASMHPNSIHHRAYQKVCMLANKALYSKRDETLVNNVSTLTIAKDVEFAQFQGRREVHRHNTQQRFNLNPFMEFKHIKVLLAKRFPNYTECPTQIRITDINHQTYPGHVLATPAQLYNARILVEQRFPEHEQPRSSPAQRTSNSRRP